MTSTDSSPTPRSMTTRSMSASNLNQSSPPSNTNTEATTLSSSPPPQIQQSTSAAAAAVEGEVTQDTAPFIINHRKHAMSRENRFLHYRDYDNLLVALKSLTGVYPDFKKGFTESLALLNSVYWKSKENASTIDRTLPIADVIAATASRSKKDEFKDWKKTDDYRVYVAFITHYQFSKDADLGDDAFALNIDENFDAENKVISSLNFSCFGELFDDQELNEDVDYQEDQVDDDSKGKDLDDTSIADHSKLISTASIEGINDNNHTLDGTEEDHTMEEDDPDSFDLQPLFGDIYFEQEWASKYLDNFHRSRDAFIPRNEFDRINLWFQANFNVILNHCKNLTQDHGMQTAIILQKVCADMVISNIDCRTLFDAFNADQFQFFPSAKNFVNMISAIAGYTHTDFMEVKLPQLVIYTIKCLLKDQVLSNEAKYVKKVNVFRDLILDKVITKQKKKRSIHQMFDYSKIKPLQQPPKRKMKDQHPLRKAHIDWKAPIVHHHSNAQNDPSIRQTVHHPSLDPSSIHHPQIPPNQPSFISSSIASVSPLAKLRNETPLKKLTTLQSHSLAAMTVDFNEAKECVSRLIKPQEQKEASQQQFLTSIVQAHLNKKSSSTNMSNQQISKKLEGSNLIDPAIATQSLRFKTKTIALSYFAGAITIDSGLFNFWNFSIAVVRYLSDSFRFVDGKNRSSLINSYYRSKQNVKWFFQALLDQFQDVQNRISNLCVNDKYSWILLNWALINTANLVQFRDEVMIYVYDKNVSPICFWSALSKMFTHSLEYDEPLSLMMKMNMWQSKFFDSIFTNNLHSLLGAVIMDYDKKEVIEKELKLSLNYNEFRRSFGANNTSFIANKAVLSRNPSNATRNPSSVPSFKVNDLKPKAQLLLDLVGQNVDRKMCLFYLLVKCKHGIDCRRSHACPICGPTNKHMLLECPVLMATNKFDEVSEKIVF